MVDRDEPYSAWTVISIWVIVCIIAGFLGGMLASLFV